MSRLIIIVVVYDYQFLNDCKQLIMILFSSLHIVPGKEYLINNFIGKNILLGNTIISDTC